MKRIFRFLFVIGVVASIFSCASAPNSGLSSDDLRQQSASSQTNDVIASPQQEGESVKAGTTDTGVKPTESVKPAVAAETTVAGDGKKKDEEKKIATAIPPPADFSASGTGDVTGIKPASAATGTAKPKTPPSQSGLKAGYSDDNQQFSYFVNFLETYARQVEHYSLNIGERIILSVQDSLGKPVPNALVEVKSSGHTVVKGKTYPDGTFTVYPLMIGNQDSYVAEIQAGGTKLSKEILRSGPRRITVSTGVIRSIPRRVPLDILFIMDTTGSMGDEIERLRSTIEIIYNNLSVVQPKPEIRFGMVLYKDIDDASEDDGYRTRIVPFTSDLDAFQAELDTVSASGGGDTPEDLQSALEDTMQRVSWNKDGIRLAFVVTDAPAHLDYGQTYTYTKAAADAKAEAIKIFTIGTGGLPLDGEYLLRQVAQYTQAKYIFLTYGEQGESEGGTEASVSHHTGSNFTTDKLEAIIMKFAKEELAYLSDVPLTIDESWFDAQKIVDESREDTLLKLFSETLRNLSDYSTFKVTGTTRAVILPVEIASDAEPELRKQAEYFSEQVMLTARNGAFFTIVERKDLQKILKELELQYSMLADEAKAAKLGQILGGEVLITGTLYRKGDRFELFLKLVRVETGEILSVAKAKIDLKLGL